MTLIKTSTTKKHITMEKEYDMQPIVDVMDSAIERLKALLSDGKKEA